MDGGGKGVLKAGRNGGELGRVREGGGGEGRKRAVVALQNVREWNPRGLPGEEGVELPWEWGTRDLEGAGQQSPATGP